MVIGDKPLFLPEAPISGRYSVTRPYSIRISFLAVQGVHYAEYGDATGLFW